MKGLLKHRFLAKIVVDEKGCWLWQDGLHHQGRYGHFWDGKKTYTAHRWATKIGAGRLGQN